MNIFESVRDGLYAGRNNLNQEDALVKLLLDLLVDAEARAPQASSVECPYSELLIRCARSKGTPGYAALARKFSEAKKLTYPGLM